MKAISIGSILRRDRGLVAALSLLILLLLAAIFGPQWTGYTYDQIADQQFAAPQPQHWLGTDVHGRDLLTRLLYGARVSFLVGLIGASVSLLIGVGYGAVAGYAGGKIDSAMMRVVEILQALPSLIFVIVLITVLEKPTSLWLREIGQPGLLPHARLILLFVGLGCVEWLTMARVVRGQVLVLREMQFVQAARALGQSPWRIITRHLLPNLFGLILVYLTLSVPAVILQESFLSFLGLGVQAPAASLGSLIADGAQVINPIQVAWWLLFFPALFMAVTLLALNILGDGLRDALDPRSFRA